MENGRPDSLVFSHYEPDDEANIKVFDTSYSILPPDIHILIPFV